MERQRILCHCHGLKRKHWGNNQPLKWRDFGRGEGQEVGTRPCGKRVTQGRGKGTENTKVHEARGGGWEKKQHTLWITKIRSQKKNIQFEVQHSYSSPLFPLEQKL